MGTCYYLIREDNRTGYELGKAWEWAEVFGGSNRDVINFLTKEDSSTLAQLLNLHSKSWDLSSAPNDYLAKVADDIIDWSEGKAFIFVSEDHRLAEEYFMEGWDHNPRQYREWITGSRFTTEMEILSISRKSGNVPSLQSRI